MLGRSFGSLILGVVLTNFSPSTIAGSDSRPAKVFYRYVNDQGVKVLHHSIPPSYAQKGYDIVSLSGKLVKSVPPAMSAAEAAAKKEARDLAEQFELWDKRLRRRYSSVADIEAAKKRKLSVLDTNIAVINSNILTRKSDILTQQKKAADVERTGRAVPKPMFDRLRTLENELEDSQEQVRLRLLEYQEVAEKYERDKRRFEEISG